MTETKETFTYYVGDLCYVLNDDEWQSVCETMDSFDEYDPENEDSVQECEGYLEPELFDWDRPDDAKPYWIFATAYGDGQYNDRDGNPYAVDSGTLGMIDVNYIEDTDKLQNALKLGLGHLHTFERRIEEADNYNDNGVLIFGDSVVIDTVS